MNTHKTSRLDLIGEKNQPCLYSPHKPFLFRLKVVRAASTICPRAANKPLYSMPRRLVVSHTLCNLDFPYYTISFQTKYSHSFLVQCCGLVDLLFILCLSLHCYLKLCTDPDLRTEQSAELKLMKVPVSKGRSAALRQHRLTPAANTGCTEQIIFVCK